MSEDTRWGKLRPGLSPSRNAERPRSRGEMRSEKLEEAAGAGDDRLGAPHDRAMPEPGLHACGRGAERRTPRRWRVGEDAALGVVPPGGARAARGASRLGLLVLLLAVGCGDGSGSGADAAVDAAPRPYCPIEVGGYPACNADCLFPCEGADLCTYGLCLPYEEDGCSFSLDDPGGAEFCPDSRLCLSREAPDEYGFYGRCMSEAFCREAQASDLGLRCWYGDLTPFEDGPEPEASCPPAPHPTTPFCGGPCGGCPDVTDEELVFESGCAGRNEERDLGICVFPEHHCDADQPSGTAGVGDDWPDTLPGLRDTACLVYRDNPRFEGNGWLTRRASCLAYRERYPEAVDCMDAEWEPLP